MKYRVSCQCCLHIWNLDNVYDLAIMLKDHIVRENHTDYTINVVLNDT